MYTEETISSRDRRDPAYQREPVGTPPTGLPPRTTPTSPAVQCRIGSSTLIAHHSPTVPRRYPVHSLRGRAWGPSSDSDTSEFAEDKGYLMRRFLDPLGEQQMLERSRSVSPVPFSMRPGSPFYEAAGGRGSLERGDSDPTYPRSEPGHIRVRRSPCRSPGLRRGRIQEDVMFEKDRLRYGGDRYEGTRHFAGQNVGPEMTRRFREQQIQRGPGRRDPLAHQLSVSSESSLDEPGFINARRVPVPAPPRIFSPRGLVTTGTSVSPCPSPTRFGTDAKPSAQDNVDYTKPVKEQAKVTLELPAGGLTVEPIPSPCPSPIIFRDIKEEDEEDKGSTKDRRSQSKSPRPRYRPEDTRQLGHVSPTELNLLSPTRSQPIVIVGDVPSIEVQGTSPEKPGLHHSPESAFRKPMKDQASLEIARERRRQKRSQSRSPSPMIVESSDRDPETVTVGFRPISPTTTTTPPHPVTGPGTAASPPSLTTTLGGAQVVRPVASPAATDTDTFSASHESRVQEMKVLTFDLLRMVFCYRRSLAFFLCRNRIPIALILGL